MNTLINWIKNNKVLTIVLVFFGYVVFVGGPQFSNSYGTAKSTGMSDIGGPTRISPSTPRNDYAPQLNVADRKTVTNSYFSILVKNVSETINNIKAQTEEFGGYMVSSSISRPTEGGSGQISVRVPLDKRDGFFDYLRQIGLRVVSENTTATDVTDEYVDIEDRLATLRSVKTRYEQILATTNDIEQILSVQQKIFSVQDQIDALVGQKQYLEATSSSVLVSISLSTDELALPYSPENPWRPGVVFKLAVRAMLSTLQDLGDLAIWIAVYAVIWVPALIIFKVVRKHLKKKSIQN